MNDRAFLHAQKQIAGARQNGAERNPDGKAACERRVQAWRRPGQNRARPGMTSTDLRAGWTINRSDPAFCPAASFRRSSSRASPVCPLDRAGRIDHHESFFAGIEDHVKRRIERGVDRGPTRHGASRGARGTLCTWGSMLAVVSHASNTAWIVHSADQVFGDFKYLVFSKLPYWPGRGGLAASHFRREWRGCVPCLPGIIGDGRGPKQTAGCRLPARPVRLRSGLSFILLEFAIEGSFTDAQQARGGQLRRRPLRAERVGWPCVRALQEA